MIYKHQIHTSVSQWTQVWQVGSDRLACELIHRSVTPTWWLASVHLRAARGASHRWDASDHRGTHLKDHTRLSKRRRASSVLPRARFPHLRCVSPSSHYAHVAQTTQHCIIFSLNTNRLGNRFDWLGLLRTAWWHKQVRDRAVCLVLFTAFLLPLLTFSSWIRLDCIAWTSLGL